jgi:hypothetical protein
MRRIRWQALALLGCIGQGSFLACHCNQVLKHKVTPATANSTILYSEITVSQGAMLINPAKAAPKPMVTSNAGNAQQISVLSEVNKERLGSSVCRQIPCSV